MHSLRAIGKISIDLLTMYYPRKIKIILLYYYYLTKYSLYMYPTPKLFMTFIFTVCALSITNNNLQLIHSQSVDFIVILVFFKLYNI